MNPPVNPIVSDATPAAKTLKISRFFTTAGVHPFDTVEWETRDARIGHGDRVAFEQRDVEFPRSWSQNATNIVAQKYFRGQLGSPERERSVRQMISRVAGTITGWGREGGYFSSEEDASAFNDELTHILLHQMAAFNSPVWFNVGFEEAPQCSACLPYHALVSTPDGMVPIGEIVEWGHVGAEVYDSHGTTRVVAVKHNGRKPVWRVRLRNGSFVEATPDHVVKAVAESGQQPSWLRVDQLEAGMRMHLHPHRAKVADPARVAVGGSASAAGAVPAAAAHELVEESDRVAIAEAALAGWLQAGGFVGPHESGTRRSLMIGFEVSGVEEFEWVMSHLEVALPNVPWEVRDTDVEGTRVSQIRLFGDALCDFVERWDLLAHVGELRVPPRLFTATHDEIVAYLRSVFEADGYVSVRQHRGHDSARIGLALTGEHWSEDVQLLLGVLGIYSRRLPKRAGDDGVWEVVVAMGSERARFAELVGFLSHEKQQRVLGSLSLRNPKRCEDLREEEIVAIERLGESEVYDIQTESGEFLTNHVAVHNCFILSVQDTMESILDWNTKEGTIFRGGSGSGINLSNIRGSMEPLAKGGTASGPVSFMRGADSWAGTIKSGGKTRRAAKMVVLDVDHPDIREFIWCKAKEEDKAEALRDAGFDMSIDGDGFKSIQYQNANNSVRLTDEFMKAVEEDRDWNLIARTTGEPVGEPIPARQLMQEIAEAAWRCADPGVQYDTTINHWHTSPNSGRINASNPCSEYMHVDDSACNLASLNLMRFRRADGTLDVEAFEHTVDTVLLAQEIIVGPSSYPTAEIGRNARAFRQLGLGYTNLGAFLMANGMPYDSDSGRAASAAITALMTGRAYRMSAEVAAAMGSYERYAENKQAHNAVMRMHRDSAYGIPQQVVEDHELIAAARKSWDEAVAQGEQFGYRNAQASVLAPTGTISFLLDCDTTGVEPDFSLVKYKELVGGGQMTIVNRTVPLALETLGYSEQQIEQIEAYIAEHGTIIGAPGLSAEHLPVFDVAVGERAISHMGHIKMMGAVQPFISGAISKCVTGDTLVATEHGLIRIDSLHEDEPEETFRDLELRISSLDGIRQTNAFYFGGTREVKRVELRSGHHVTGTPNHRLLICDHDGLAWKRLDELEPGDFVATQYGDELWSSTPPRFDDFAPSPRYGSQKKVNIPDAMDERLAFFLGVYAAEGHVTRSTWTVHISNADEAVIPLIAATAEAVFEIKPRIVREPGKCPLIQLSSKRLVEFLEYLGCGHRASNKLVPEAILRSPREMVLGFIEGLCLDAYITNSGTSKWAICLDSPQLLDSLQAILTNLGILHSRITKAAPRYEKTFDEVYVCGREAQRLVGLLRFVEPHKARRAEIMAAAQFASSSADVVPGIGGVELYSLIPKYRGVPGSGRSRQFSYLTDPRTQHVSRTSLERVAVVDGVELPEWLDVVLDRNLHFSPVVLVEDAGEQVVYDVSVPVTHAFVANGIVNHNTVNMPESASVEDIAEAYIEAWRLGIKALAIYRDGSKTAQALRTDAQKEKPAPQDIDALVDQAVKKALSEAGPRRRRMPRERQSLTHKFSIAGHEGYITAGMYEDGSVGEIFLTDIGKEGSTLRGMMNSFATAISIALQYGVPLETLVQKFSYMRFEPEGITGNPEIPFAKSMPDYIMRWLASRFLDADTQEELGILTPEVRARKAAQDAAQSLTATDTAGPSATDTGRESDPSAQSTAGESTNGGNGATTVSPAAASLTETPPVLPARLQGLDLGPACNQCGGMMQRTGACYTCSSCGNNTGCG